LAIEDVTEREYYKRHLEDIVEKRTAELRIAKEDALNSKHLAENALAEIKQLTDQLEAERAYLQEEIKLEFNHENIIGRSNEIKYVFYKVEQIAATDTNVLVLGETGTGKELVARAIHGLSMRKDRALVKMNCAALPSNLIESELFGHEKGAFTDAHSKRLGRFEIANGTPCFWMRSANCPWSCSPNCSR
jgi:transcriptional regulator with GAF, ATPase, and Fis domain